MSINIPNEAQIEAASQARDKLRELFTHPVLTNHETALDVTKKAKVGYEYDLELIGIHMKRARDMAESSDNTEDGITMWNFMACLYEVYQSIRPELEPVIRYLQEIDNTTHFDDFEAQEALGPAFDFLYGMQELDTLMSPFQACDPTIQQGAKNDNEPTAELT